MSKQPTRLGLGNAVNADTEVLHTSIMGKRAFGRITDLLLAWAEKHHSIPYQEAASIRILAQALMEFSYPEGRQDLGQLEFAVEGKKRYISIRFPGGTRTEAALFEKEITTLWMGSEKATWVKKNLGPHDRVEVRYHDTLNVVEWRIVYRVGDYEIELDQPSFMAYVDSTDKIGSFHKKFTDLGDLPFDRLLSEIYKNNEGRRTGEMFYKGQSLQGEEETARVIFEKEQAEIEDEVRFTSRNKVTEQELAKITDDYLTEEDHEDIRVKADVYLENTVAQLRFEQSESKDHFKELIRESKQKELAAQRRMISFHQKIIKLEDLLRRKEMSLARNQGNVKLLSDKLTELQSKSGNEGSIKAFRDKALQMHAMLVKVKQDNAGLEKLMHEMRNRESNREAIHEADQILARSTSVNGAQLEEVSKKADRLQRALDAEKLKVKQLSERVMNSERESNNAGPIIEDLERKIEQSMKVSQMYKKEAETLKQKLVQSQSEVNKTNNELVKTKAEIQSFLKRKAG